MGCSRAVAGATTVRCGSLLPACLSVLHRLHSCGCVHPNTGHLWDVGDVVPCHRARDSGTQLMSHSSVLAWILNPGEKRLPLASSPSVAHRPAGGQLHGPRRLLHQTTGPALAPSLGGSPQCLVSLSASPWSPSPAGAPAGPLPGMPSSCW